ncbi:hypothetical protein EJB05_32835, partial [Eragrostis curvula]
MVPSFSPFHSSLGSGILCFVGAFSHSQINHPCCGYDFFLEKEVAENLAQTGYMFRNTQYHLELQQSLEQIALPEPKEEKDSPDYALGTQKKSNR